MYGRDEVTHTRKFIREFVESNILEPYEGLPDGRKFKIMMYPKEANRTHIKFRILRDNIDERTINLSDPYIYSRFTGWVCNERQHAKYMNKYHPGWDGELLSTAGLGRFMHASYVENDIPMTLSHYDEEDGIYLHSKDWDRRDEYPELY